MIKEKATFLNEFLSLGSYFFVAPETYDTDVIKKRWNEKTKNFIAELNEEFKKITNFSATETENIFKTICEKSGIKTGEVMQSFRVCLSGVGGGPALFEVVELLGKEEVVNRLEKALSKIGNQ